MAAGGMPFTAKSTRIPIQRHIVSKVDITCYNCNIIIYENIK